jgi:hypothetical protein
MSLVSLLLAVLALAPAGLAARSAGAQSDVHVVWPSPSTYRFLDFGHDGLRLGDRLASRGPLVDETHTTQVGYAHQECVVMRRITDAPSGLYRCSYLLKLAGGDLTIEGLDPHGPGTYTFAVLGGTGTYAGAIGQAMLTDTATATDMVIDLSP